MKGQGRGPNMFGALYRKPLDIEIRLQWNTYLKWRLGCLLVTFPMMSRVEVKTVPLIYLDANVSKYSVRDRDSVHKDHQ